jgi:ATP-dependent RNA helicase RhlE
MIRFSELPLSSCTQERLSAARFSIPTPVQAAAIPPALEGKDILATAQTGTGKTLAFLIPILEQFLKTQAAGPQALVLVPTRELAMQVAGQFNALRGKQLAAALLVGGVPEGPQLTALRAGAQLIVATPGRLEDFMGRRLVKLSGIRTLVLDEADRMLDMGFVPSIRRITAALPRDRQTLCFSATLEASVAQLVTDTMRSPVRLAFGSTSKPASSIELRALQVPAEDKMAVLQHLLTAKPGRSLVFARTKRGAERLAKRLAHGGFAATTIHGDRSQSQRTAALSGFQQGRFNVLVATDIAARGIHIDNVAHVINYDLPAMAEDFVHRVGRTGRAGECGVASTFVTNDEIGELQQLERALDLRMQRLRVRRTVREQTPA